MDEKGKVLEIKEKKLDNMIEYLNEIDLELNNLISLSGDIKNLSGSINKFIGE